MKVIDMDFVKSKGLLSVCTCENLFEVFNYISRRGICSLCFAMAIAFSSVTQR